MEYIRRVTPYLVLPGLAQRDFYVSLLGSELKSEKTRRLYPNDVNFITTY